MHMMGKSPISFSRNTAFILFSGQRIVARLRQRTYAATLRQEAGMVPTAPQVSSFFNYCRVNGGLWTSPHGSTVSSGAMSTTSSEKHPMRPCSPTPSVGIIAARLMELEPEKDRWRRVAREWYAKVIAEFLAAISCTIIWDFSVARQKARSYMQFTTSLRGKVVGFRTANFLIIFWSFSMIATHPFETAQGVCRNPTLSSHYGCQRHRCDARLLTHARRNFLFPSQHAIHKHSTR
jgi:hypothetical protein